MCSCMDVHVMGVLKMLINTMLSLKLSLFSSHKLIDMFRIKNASLEWKKREKLLQGSRFSEQVS